VLSLHVTPPGALAPGVQSLVSRASPRRPRIIPQPPPQLHLTLNLSDGLTKHQIRPHGLRMGLSPFARAEGRGFEPDRVATKCFPTQHWKNMGCHVVPSDWATCYLVIHPYGTVNTQSTYTISCHITTIQPHVVHVSVRTSK
jgi:hypothetical protein